MRGVVGLGALAVVVAAAVSLTACGDRETPEQKLERLRFNHEIIPVGATTLRADTDPTVVVDLQIVNHGTEALRHLTVLVRVTGGDGGERLRRRVTLDLEGVRPGVGERRSALVPGFILAEDDEVSVQLEPNLPDDALRSLPEFGDLGGGR